MAENAAISGSIFWARRFSLTDLHRIPHRFRYTTVNAYSFIFLGALHTPHFRLLEAQ